MPSTQFLDESLRAAIARAAEQQCPSLPASRRAPITRVSKPPILPSIPLRHRRLPRPPGSEHARSCTRICVQLPLFTAK